MHKFQGAACLFSDIRANKIGGAVLSGVAALAASAAPAQR